MTVLDYKVIDIVDLTSPNEEHCHLSVQRSFAGDAEATALGYEMIDVVDLRSPDKGHGHLLTQRGYPHFVSIIFLVD